jgi:hypothetical protein
LIRGHTRMRGHASRDLSGDPGFDPALAPLTARADLRSSSETACPRRRAKRCVALPGADSDPAPSSFADDRPDGPGTGPVSAKISNVWLIVGSPGDCYPTSQHGMSDQTAPTAALRNSICVTDNSLYLRARQPTKHLSCSDRTGAALRRLVRREFALCRRGAHRPKLPAFLLDLDRPTFATCATTTSCTQAGPATAR